MTRPEIRLEAVTGDITRQADLGAVVNAANAQLMPGGGVAGAIHRAAGPELAEACRPMAPISPGQAVITEAFGLPNRWIIHCLGPRYGIDEPADTLLADCYRNALRLAEERGIDSIAFPALSTGAFGYPFEDASRVALDSVDEVLAELQQPPGLVRFVFFSDNDREQFESVRQRG
ncbi:macro domain-containing protein [Aquisalimonas sp. 2447]|uniref:macro domain-containing protein n=1 Tax=Aquisalimonas sp. 2447 TaxID=2740807 RepID=UPI0014323067|nr:macro domain-containing protein [Aquisalimonas sp. 2447]QIT54340.1 macro domain-containing protein [Aquisalimonas sp. 2447]